MTKNLERLQTLPSGRKGADRHARPGVTLRGFVAGDRQRNAVLGEWQNLLCCTRNRNRVTPLQFTQSKLNPSTKDNPMGAQWKAKGKALVADAKGKLFGKLVKEITVAARGGADPASNSRLRLVVEQARKASMPKDTLERAIKKGSGTGADAVNYERVLYEGFAPHQVAVMVECLTDNVNRTAPEMRVLFRKGQLGTSGSVAWDFDHVGMIEAEPATPDADPEVAAIEAGAQDFEAAGDGEDSATTLFWTDPTDLDLVSRALPAQGFTVLSAKLGYRPKNPVDPANLSAEQLEEVEAFLAAIDANDDVQNVFVALGG